MKYAKTLKRAWRGVVLFLMLFFSIGAVSPVAAKTITISPKYFPDKAMRAALREFTSKEKMTQAARNRVDSIELEGGERKINFKGIEYFPKLKKLIIEEGAKTRTLPKIPKLKELQYYNDSIGELKLPHYPKLEWLCVYGKNIKQLELLQNKHVQELSLGTPKLENLDVSLLSELEYLGLENMDLTGLDLSHNLKLKYLKLTKTRGELPDVSVLPKLKSLSLSKQYLGMLEMSNNSSIEQLKLEDCRYMTAIHIADCSKLKQLTLGDCTNIATIYIENCPNLKQLSIEKSYSLQEIRIKGCGKFNNLEVEDCSDLKSIVMAEGCGKLDRLEIKKCPILESVTVDEKCRMTGLIMKHCRKMTDAGMKQMNLSKLSELCVEETGVANLSAKRFPKLKSLQFYKNAQKKIDFQSLKNLKLLRIGYEKTTKVLDVTMLPKLRSLSWTHGALKGVRLGKESCFNKLDLSYNQLSGNWNMQKFKKLNIFKISYNRITSLDMGKMERDMEEIRCRHNKLKKVQVEEVYNLPVFDCRDNPGVKVYMNSSDDECMDWSFGKKAKVYYKYG